MIFRQIRNDVAPDVSCRTVSRRLDEAGLHSRRPREKPLLSAKNIEDRFEYGKWMEKKPKHWLQRPGKTDLTIYCHSDLT